MQLTKQRRSHAEWLQFCKCARYDDSMVPRGEGWPTVAKQNCLLSSSCLQQLLSPLFCVQGSA